MHNKKRDMTIRLRNVHTLKTHIESQIDELKLTLSSLNKEEEWIVNELDIINGIEYD